jgi:hypothetical protein
MPVSSVEVDVTLTKGDLVRFGYYSLLRLWGLWPLFGTWLLTILVAILDWLIEGGTVLIANVAPLSGLVLVILVLVYFGATRQWKNRPFILDPCRWTFDANGPQQKAKSFSAQFGWSTVASVRETKSLILLYEGKNMARIIPKRCFESSAALAEFKELLTQHIAPKKIVGPGPIGRWF